MTFAMFVRTLIVASVLLVTLPTIGGAQFLPRATQWSAADSPAVVTLKPNALASSLDSRFGKKRPGRARYVVRGSIIGAGIGFIVGSGLGSAKARKECRDVYFCVGTGTVLEYMGRGLLAGAALGAVAGALVPLPDTSRYSPRPNEELNPTGVLAPLL